MALDETDLDALVSEAAAILDTAAKPFIDGHRADSAVQKKGNDFATEVDDDGVDERRRASIEAIEERVRLLNGRMSIESREEGGTAIRVVMPAYVAAAQG